MICFANKSTETDHRALCAYTVQRVFNTQMHFVENYRLPKESSWTKCWGFTGRLAFSLWPTKNLRSVVSSLTPNETRPTEPSQFKGKSSNSTCCVTSRHDKHDVYAQNPLGPSRHVSCVSRASWRACRAWPRISRRACYKLQHGWRRIDAVVLACTSLVFCALDLHQSQEQLVK